MPKKNPAVDPCIAAAAPFARPILQHLRKVMHAGCPEVVETMKWSRPHFGYKGSLAVMSAFKAHCAFGFWRGSLIFDQKMAERDDAMGHFGRITQVSDLPDHKTLIGYVRKAVELNEAGITVPRPARKAVKKLALEVPDDLARALRKNAAAAKSFADFSPSHRREYIEWLTEAKREETRQRRLATALEWLAEGKPRMWKYLPQR